MSGRLEGFKREVLNLPNIITIGRLFLIPPVLLLLGGNDPWRGVYAMMVFLTASLLDVVDGWLARRQGLVTFFGKFVDPLADKIMVMALLVYLVGDGRLPAWVVVVLLGREFYISGLRTLALGEGVEIVAGGGGKAKTSFQLIGISFLLVHYSYRVPIFGGWIDFHKVGSYFVYFSVAVSLYSAYSYTRGFVLELSRASKDDDEDDPGS